MSLSPGSKSLSNASIFSMDEDDMEHQHYATPTLYGEETETDDHDIDKSHP